MLSELLGVTAPPLFLNPTTFRLVAAGGTEVGPWSVDVTLPPEIIWSNQASFQTIDRGFDQTFTWAGGNSTQFIQIVAVNVSVVEEIAAGFACLAHQTDGSLTVPSTFLSGIPASTPLGPEGDLTSLGIVLFGATQYADLPQINADGLDSGQVVNIWTSLVTAAFL